MRIKFLVIFVIGLFVTFDGEIKAEEDICEYSKYSQYKKLLPIESALDNVKIINLEKKYSVMLKNGIMLNLKSIKRKIDSDNKLILVKADNKLVSIAYLKKEYIIPRRNFNL